MGAETTFFVKVTREVVAWIEVQAITIEEARKIAKRNSDVVRVLDVQYAESYSES